MMSCRILNGACRLLYQKEYRRFWAVRDAEKVQRDYLMRLLRKNAAAEYGKRYGFSSVASYEE